MATSLTNLEKEMIRRKVTNYFMAGIAGGSLSGATHTVKEDNLFGKLGKVALNGFCGGIMGISMCFWPISVPVVSYFAVEFFRKPRE